MERGLRRLLDELVIEGGTLKPRPLEETRLHICDHVTYNTQTDGWELEYDRHIVLFELSDLLKINRHFKATHDINRSFYTPSPVKGLASNRSHQSRKSRKSSAARSNSFCYKRRNSSANKAVAYSFGPRESSKGSHYGKKNSSRSRKSNSVGSVPQASQFGTPLSSKLLRRFDRKMNNFVNKQFTLEYSAEKVVHYQQQSPSIEHPTPVFGGQAEPEVAHIDIDPDENDEQYLRNSFIGHASVANFFARIRTGMRVEGGWAKCEGVDGGVWPVAHERESIVEDIGELPDFFNEQRTRKTYELPVVT